MFQFLRKAIENDVHNDIILILLPKKLGTAPNGRSRKQFLRLVILVSLMTLDSRVALVILQAVDGDGLAQLQIPT